MGITAIAEKSRAFVANLEGNITVALDSVSEEFVKINDEQMSDHKTADDVLIQPKYSPQYAIMKGFSDPDLKLTGDFRNAMYFRTDGKRFMLGSTDWKMPKLISRYSDRIFGIAPSKTNNAQEIAKNSIAKLYNEKVLG